MKALSLWQPWATLVAIGAKQIETRSWKTSHRGLLAIHATNVFSDENRKLAYMAEPFASTLIMAGYNLRGPLRAEFLPLGAIVAVVDLVGCSTTNDIPMHWDVSAQERAFGDYSANRYAWFLGNIRQLKTPVPCRGWQQLWNVPAEIVAEIEAQLAEPVDERMTCPRCEGQKYYKGDCAVCDNKGFILVSDLEKQAREEM